MKRGQPLAILYSTDLSDAQFAFLKAVSQQSLSERAVERGKQLLDADVIGSAEQQRRQAELVQATAEVSSLRQQLRALGMSEDSIHDLESSRKLNSRYEVLASIDGTVLERSITVGQIVQPAEVAFLLADLSKVWLVADIPEQNAGDVAVGKAVEAEAAAFPGEPIVGRLSFVSATVNPESRTVRVRMNVSNPRGRYKPAMLATMRLKDRGQRERVIPVTAVVRENNRDNVFMQTGPKTFVLREVELGGEFGDVRTLISGIEPNQTIVLDGAFHVNNERKKALQRRSLDMLRSIVSAALKQRLVILVVALCLVAFGVNAARHLSVDAFPDVTNVQVQVATEAPGRSPEEVERFVTVPIEIATTGLPGLTEMRSLNKPGLSLITLVFEDNRDVYLERQLVMERLTEVREKLPAGVSPVLGPVSSALGEVYQYTLDGPNDGEKPLTKEQLVERRTIQDWVVRPLLRSIPGVAEINSTGGYVKQYQALVDPVKVRYYGLTIKDVFDALARNNANAGGGILPQHAEQYLIRGIGLIRNLDDIRNIVLKEVGGTPVYVRDVAEVRFGEEIRYGAMVKGGYTEAVGGIVMMIAGGNAKEIVGRVKERVEEINQGGAIPHGLKIVPYYDRSDLVDAALHTVSKVLEEGIVLVVVILFLFLGDLRSSIIVIGTLILTPLLTFMVMNHYGLSANLMSLGGLAIAIGLMVDGSVVVVENIFANLGHSHGRSKTEVILDAVGDVATPVIFGVGIIILVFLPLMTLEGMEGKMFAPLAYTIAIALGDLARAVAHPLAGSRFFPFEGRIGARHMGCCDDQTPIPLSSSVGFEQH